MRAISETPVVELDISSAWPSALAALASLDDSLAQYRESLEKIKAADSVDVAEVIEQFKLAAESARNLRALIASERPEASWQKREELDALIEEEIQKSLKARDLEQRRLRILSLATELESGSIARRRASRVNQLTQLRDQAVSELRSQAAVEGAPPTLPGPEPHEWVAWACGLQEPEDAESLETLREGFPHLDDFVADLDPSLWIPVGSEAPLIELQPAKSDTQTHPEQSRQETSPLGESAVPSGPTPIGSKDAKHGEPTVPHSLEPPSSPDNAAPHAASYVTPTPTEAAVPATEDQERPPLIAAKVISEPSDAAVADADVSSEGEEAWQSAQRMRQSSLLRGNPLGNVSMTLLRPDIDLFQSKRLRNTVWTTAIVAFVVAVAMLGFGISLHHQMKKLSAQVTETSEANRKAIQDGIQTDQRAWVGLAESAVHPLSGNGGGFTIKLQNTGKTPALDLQIADIITVEDNDQVGPVQDPTITSSAGTLMPGAVYSADVWFKTSPEVVSGLTKERLRATNYMNVTYKDIFKQTHTTKACFYWHGGMAKTKPCDRYNELN